MTLQVPPRTRRKPRRAHALSLISGRQSTLHGWSSPCRQSRTSRFARRTRRPSTSSCPSTTRSAARAAFAACTPTSGGSRSVPHHDRRQRAAPTAPGRSRAGSGAELDDVEAVRLEQKGRGRALHHVWSASDAQVLAYMDVDLSTDLAALLPLVAPLLSGHSDLAIGTRLARGARVVRGPKRELISRCYNRCCTRCCATRFSDAQCGFKAIRADGARELLPLVRGPAGSSTPSCSCSPSAPGCASTRCRSTGSTTPTPGSTSSPPRRRPARRRPAVARPARRRARPAGRQGADAHRVSWHRCSLRRDRRRLHRSPTRCSSRPPPSLRGQAANALALLLTAIANTAANRRLRSRSAAAGASATSRRGWRSSRSRLP